MESDTMHKGGLLHLTEGERERDLFEGLGHSRAVLGSPRLMEVWGLQAETQETVAVGT
jgi:hypothetical protein